MPSNGDVTYDFQAFRPENVHAQTTKLNVMLVEKSSQDPKWWEVGAVEYRTRRATGKTAFPAPVILLHGTYIQVQASDAKLRNIRCRVFKPEGVSKGVFYHIHGGGWVLGTVDGQDLLLDHIVKNTGLTAISVEYRLAPEHVFPAGVDDCNDVAEWICTKGREEFGDLKFIGGESAGGTLSAMVILYLRSKGLLSTLAGSILNYGCYDLSLLPSALLAGPETPILPGINTIMFTKTWLSGITTEERKDGMVSPLYNDLKSLGSALFLIGTEDSLIDDSILMHFRWVKAGNEGVLKFVAGAPHGFMTFDGNTLECSKEGWKIMVEYINERL